VFTPPPDRPSPGLFDAIPRMRGAVPWRPLCHVPTAVEPCAALDDGGGAERVWAKRDDRISPVYGGNKVRRFEFVFADLAARGARRVVTAGGIASTQVTATACFGAALGLPVRAVLFDQPVTRFAREAILTDVTAGAELVYGGGYARTAWRTARALRGDGDARLILPGASHPLANLGYLDAMLELDGQVRAGMLPRPDVIVVPAGSSGTLAALALGVAWLGWRTEVVGVRITALAACNRFTVALVAAATRRFVARFDPAFARLRPRFTLHHGAIGPGYGEPTAEARANIPRIEGLIGRPGEVTYSAKALAGLRALAATPRHRRSTFLFWHTLSSVRPAIAPDARARVPPALGFVFDGEPTA
jgi:D-cysteine desulfhydrase